MIILTDQELMQVAIDEAIKGLKIGDQPFGSVIVINDEIVSIGRNKINSSFDITAHAEILAIKKASKEQKIIDFSAATIYATWEPCTMWLGAIISANISKLVIRVRLAIIPNILYLNTIKKTTKIKPINKESIPALIES